jgi:hypothetical protein
MSARNLLFSLVLVSFVGANAQAALLSQWKFDNNLNDSAGPNHLAATGSPTFSASVAPGGYSSNALSLTTGSYAGDTTPSGLGFTGTYTIAGWFNLQGNTTPQFRSLFWRGLGTTNSDLEIYLQPTGDNRLTLAHNRANGGTFGGNYYPAPTLNGYTHLAVSWTGSNWDVYYNGVLQAVNASFGTPGQPLAVTAGHEIRFGSIAYTAFGGNGALNGLLDEWSVFSGNLTPSQITNLIEFNDINGPAAPEPSTLLLLGMSMLGLAVHRRNRRSVTRA